MSSASYNYVTASIMHLWNQIYSHTELRIIILTALIEQEHHMFAKVNVPSSQERRRRSNPVRCS